MANQLLLLDDVDGLGRSGDVVRVRPGYARNFLLPQGLAVIANKHALLMQAKLQEERRKRAIVDKQEAEKLALRFQDVVLTTFVKVDPEGNMYGSVTTTDIVDLLKNQADIELERRSVHLPQSIKTIGTHTVKLKLKEGVLSAVKVQVVAEGGEVPVEVPAEQPQEA